MISRSKNLARACALKTTARRRRKKGSFALNFLNPDQNNQCRSTLWWTKQHVDATLCENRTRTLRIILVVYTLKDKPTNGWDYHHNIHSPPLQGMGGKYGYIISRLVNDVSMEMNWLFPILEYYCN